jgi:Indigoidine synthase A like protein
MLMPPLSKGLLRRFRAAGGYAESPLKSSRRHFGSRNDFFKVSEEVREGLHHGKPVVALETTIYTHGLCPVRLYLCC